MSTMLHGAELWPLTVAQKKPLEAAHQVAKKNDRYLMEQDKVYNERVRVHTENWRR